MLLYIVQSVWYKNNIFTVDLASNLNIYLSLLLLLCFLVENQYFIILFVISSSVSTFFLLDEYETEIVNLLCQFKK